MSAPLAYRRLPVDLADVRYAHGPDSQRQIDVPAGESVELVLADSATYPGTSRKV